MKQVKAYKYDSSKKSTFFVIDASHPLPQPARLKVSAYVSEREDSGSETHFEQLVYWKASSITSASKTKNPASTSPVSPAHEFRVKGRDWTLPDFGCLTTGHLADCRNVAI